MTSAWPSPSCSHWISREGWGLGADRAVYWSFLGENTAASRCVDPLEISQVGSILLLLFFFSCFGRWMFPVTWVRVSVEQAGLAAEGQEGK